MRNRIVGKAVPIGRLIALVAIASALVQGCECRKVEQREAFRHADMVFRGRVTQIDHLRLVHEGDAVRVEAERNPPGVDDHTVVSFNVLTRWKGKMARGIKVYAVGRPSMCDGYRFEEGTEYVVYTRHMEPPWPELEKSAGGAIYEVGPCPLRVVRDGIGREVRALGRGRTGAGGR